MIFNAYIIIYLKSTAYDAFPQNLSRHR